MHTSRRLGRHVEQGLGGRPYAQKGLEVTEDFEFEQRQWRIQRAGWAIMALILLGALLGLFGDGPLSHAQASSGALRVEYERFLHADAPATLRISVHAPPPGPVRLGIDRRYLDAVPMKQIRPRPVQVIAAGDELLYEFAAPAGGDLHVSIDASPEAPGLPQATVRLVQRAGPAPLHFRQLIYP